MIESILLTTAQLTTHQGAATLSTASGFFFERAGRLFIVTSRHVLVDETIGHHPDRLVITVHHDRGNLAATVDFSILLFQDGTSTWRQAGDSAGDIDVAAVEIDRGAFPEQGLYRAFTPSHLLGKADRVEVGTPALVIGFPLGFHDALHHTPVARQAIVASSFGLRFQGQGYFLTDARTHRGSSGAPVVMRTGDETAELPWRLLGIHSSRMDMGGRDLQADEALGLNCAWYADVLLTLTEDPD